MNDVGASDRNKDGKDVQQIRVIMKRDGAYEFVIMTRDARSAIGR